MATDFLGGLGTKFNFGLGEIGNILLIIFVVFVVFSAIGGIVAFIIWRKTYSEKVIVFGRIGNKPTVKYNDKAKYIKFGLIGDKLLYCRKLKKYLPPPNIQIAPHTWWMFEREDGEYINFSLADIDEKMREMGAYFVDVDMRLSRVATEKNLRSRLEKIGFWQKYGGTVAGFIFVVLITVALVVLFAKLVDVSKALESVAEAVKEMAGAVNNYYTNSSTIKPVDTGLVPV